MSNVSVRSLAFYLPQFHPIPETDLWFGKGHTDWTDVSSASPLFEGHAQPRLPRDLGFYDLRLAEVREAQAALARQYGIDGFIYNHYWFDGRRVLERPFDEVLRSQSPDFPFALCWVNEDWCRDTGEVLIPQTYSEADDRQHIQWIIQAMRDPRYIRIDDKPLLVVQNVAALPNAARSAEIWRSEARNAGIGEIFLTFNQDNPPSFLASRQARERNTIDPSAVGFDAAIDTGSMQSSPTRPATEDYLDFAADLLSRSEPNYRYFPCVTPGFDNTPKFGSNGCVLTSSHPDLYKGWVAATVQREITRGRTDIVLFVNAWNRWADGAILEPCSVWDSAYLEAHAAGITQGVPSQTQAPVAASAPVAAIGQPVVSTTPQTYVSPAVTQTTTAEAIAAAQTPPPSVSQPVASEVEIGNTEMNRTGLTVAIVTNGDAEALMNTLRSALDTCQGMGAVDFLVVDNATEDETPLLLDALKADVRSIRTETQLTANAAWMLAKQASQGEYVLLVSNDVTLMPGWLEPVVISLATDPTCSAASPAQAFNGQTFPSQPITSTSGVCLLVRDSTDVLNLSEAKFVSESIVEFNVAQPVAGY